MYIYNELKRKKTDLTNQGKTTPTVVPANRPVHACMPHAFNIKHE